MKIRNTETTEVPFQQAVFERVGFGELQGLTMTKDWEPTAAVEAVDFEPGEQVEIGRAFTDDALRQRWLFANALSVPLYVVASSAADAEGPAAFHIFEVGDDNGRISVQRYCRPVEEREFVRFWRGLKGTPQTKPLPDAGRRISASRVDQVLERAGLAWGGNVDGFLTEGPRVRAIVECRRTTKKPLDAYDPDLYFRRKRGGDYNTWRPLVEIGRQLRVPVVLLTFQSGRDRCGCAIVDGISREGLKYRKGIRPCDNLCDMDRVMRIFKRLRSV